MPVKQHLERGDNSLEIAFASAFLKGRDLQKEHGQFDLWNGDPSRLHVRKAGYKYAMTSSIILFRNPKERTTAMGGTGVLFS